MLSLVDSEEGSSLKKRQFGFGDFDGGLDDGGSFDGGLYDGGLDFFGGGNASPQATSSEGVFPEVETGKLFLFLSLTLNFETDSLLYLDLESSFSCRWSSRTRR